LNKLKGDPVIECVLVIGGMISIIDVVISLLLGDLP